MANFGSPAHGAAMGTAGGMMIIAAGAVGLATAIGDGMRAAREESELDAYSDALGRATLHARQLEVVVDFAERRIRDLEAEVASLRRACAQREQVISMLSGRVW